MEITTLLDIHTRAELYRWFEENHASAKEFWIRVNRSAKDVPGVIRYDDAVEVALCFGWIDSTLKRLDGGKPVQRFSPRRKGSNWCGRNLSRCRRLIALGQMTPAGLALLPNGNKLIAFLLGILFLVGCGDAGIKEAVAEQLQLYPESRVQDVYKSFCQDNLGPGHLIPNPDDAKAYLLSELEQYRSDLDSALYEKPALRFVPVGDCGNYVRVDLSVVLDGQIDSETLLDAFVRSANEGRTITAQQWKRKWRRVAAVLRRSFPDIPEASADLAAIDSLISEGHLILHHSEAFANAYHPHYRIVARELLEQE